MKAVITVLGKDMVGILAKVSGLCAESGANVAEVTQSILGGLFAMIMLVEIDESKTGIKELSGKLDLLAKETGLEIHITNEELFNSMHKI